MIKLNWQQQAIYNKAGTGLVVMLAGRQSGKTTLAVELAKRDKTKVFTPLVRGSDPYKVRLFGDDTNKKFAGLDHVILDEVDLREGWWEFLQHRKVKGITVLLTPDTRMAKELGVLVGAADFVIKVPSPDHILNSDRFKTMRREVYNAEFRAIW